MEKKLPWDIIISKLRGCLTVEDVISFENWLNEEDNRQLFQQLQTVWENVQNKVATYEPDLEYYWKELSARINQEDSQLTSPQLEVKSIPLKRFYRIVAAASILLAITFSGAYYLGRNNISNQSAQQTYSSLTGKSKVILPDGTEVWLHSNTTLSYNANFSSNTREVNMNGEAYFSVTHDANKPFIVHSNSSSVTVHGTKFNVNSYESSQNILVSLFEGSVSMKAANNNVMLRPGQEGYYDKSKNKLEVKEGDVEFAKSWTNDQLRFENKNLREVCKYLSKWYSVEIQVDPSISDRQSYSFTLRNESLEEITRLLSKVNTINYQFVENNKLIIKSKKIN